MKKLFTIASVVLLTACVDARGYALQDQFCSDKGGVFEYATSDSAFGFGYCMDNTGFQWLDINKQTLRPEFYPDKED